MSKVSEKKARKEIIMNANNKIYKNLVQYLIGPKWKHGYQIGDINSKSKAFGIIKVKNGYMCPMISIYFSRDIHIYMKLRDHAFEYDFDYAYFESDTDFTIIPENLDDYILKSTTFLKELLREVACKNIINYGYTDLVNLSECVESEKPEGFNTETGIWTILEQSYSYNNRPDIIEYVTAIMKSKKYKRFRGDNK